LASGKFEYHQLRCFVSVAEELNFRRAAERMNMTQPPLSRQIKLLEHGIGLTLLERSNKQVRLTSAGENFYDSAIEMLQRAEQSVLKARQAERGETGSIELGFVPSAALDFIPRIFIAMNQHLPGVKLIATEMMSYEIVEAQASGRLDLGLTRMEVPRSGIQRVKAVSEGFVLAVPAEHRLARAETPTMADLDGERFIGYSTDRGGFLRETHQSLFALAEVNPNIVLEFSQTHTVLAMVNRGLGVALVPGSSRVLQMANVCFRDIELPRRFRSDLYLVYRSTRRTKVQEKVRVLIMNTLAATD